MVYIYIYTHTHTHTHIYIKLFIKKATDAAICNNMDKTGGHYAKWNKPDTGKKIVWSHLYVESKRYIEIKQNYGYQERRGRRNVEMLIKENKIAVTRDQ